MATSIITEDEINEREAMFQNLTVGQDFNSKTAKMQAERARRLEESKEVSFTVYEG